MSIHRNWLRSPGHQQGAEDEGIGQHSLEHRETVAREAGFGDPDRMRRAFLRAYGQPPQVIRRANRGEARRT